MIFSLQIQVLLSRLVMMFDFEETKKNEVFIYGNELSFVFSPFLPLPFTSSSMYNCSKRIHIENALYMTESGCLINNCYKYSKMIYLKKTTKEEMLVESEKKRVVHSYFNEISLVEHFTSKSIHSLFILTALS